MNTGNSELNTVDVRAENAEPPSWTPALTKFVHRVLHRLGITGWEVSVLLCDADFIQRLNHDFRRIDAPTDVLSFSGDGANPDGTTYAGDIVIALPIVELQADELHVPYEEELRRVTVHGLLHLYGYEHTSNDFSREPMLIVQEEIVQELKEKLF